MSAPAADPRVKVPVAATRARARDGLILELTAEQLLVLAEALARPVAEIIDAHAARSSPSPWVDAAGAAVHLCCTRDRIHDLVGLGKLNPRRDGRRLLFRRDDLDAYLEAAT